MNKEEWEANTLHEVEEKVISTLGIQKPTPQERNSKGAQDDKGKEPKKEVGNKRTREDQTDTDIDPSTKEFKMKYMKRARIHMDIDQGSEKDQQIVITIGDSPSSSPEGGQTIFSTSSATVPFQQQNV